MLADVPGAIDVRDTIEIGTGEVDRAARAVGGRRSRSRLTSVRRPAASSSSDRSFGPSNGSGGRLSRSFHAASTRSPMSASLASVSGAVSRLKLRTKARSTTASLRIAGSSPSRNTARMNVRGSLGVTIGVFAGQQRGCHAPRFGILFDARPVPRQDLGPQRRVVVPARSPADRRG